MFVDVVQRELGEMLGKNFPGFNFEVLPFLSERIKETLSGSEGTLAVKIFGDKLEDLDVAAQASRNIRLKDGRVLADERVEAVPVA